MIKSPPCVVFLQMVILFIPKLHKGDYLFYNSIALTNAPVLIFHAYLSRMIRKERPNFATTEHNEKLAMSFINLHHKEIA